MAPDDTDKPVETPPGPVEKSDVRKHDSTPVVPVVAEVVPAGENHENVGMEPTVRAEGNKAVLEQAVTDAKHVDLPLVQVAAPEGVEVPETTRAGAKGVAGEGGHTYIGDVLQSDVPTSGSREPAMPSDRAITQEEVAKYNKEMADKA